MSDSDDVPVRAIVCDVGSGYVKAGFAGDSIPRAVFPSTVGRPRRRGITDFVVGDEALYRSATHNLSCPLNYGIVTNWNWDDTEKILYHTFNELRVDPTEHPVLLTDIVNNSKANKERMTQLMFESFEVPEFALAAQPGLALYATGRTSGIVVDSGHNVTYSVPIVEGRPVPLGIRRLSVAGRHLTDALVLHLARSGAYHFDSTPSNIEIVRDMKERLGYVALDYHEERGQAREKRYQLPDGEVVIVDDERFKCAEPLFEPSIVGVEAPGVHEMIEYSISKCRDDRKREMYRNIVLAGGSTMFPGIADRLIKEVTELAPPHTRVKVVASPNRKYNTWIGGSILASLRTFQQEWISKREYEEYGPEIVNQRSS